MDQNVRLALQEQAKVLATFVRLCKWATSRTSYYSGAGKGLATAFQHHASIIQAVGSKIPNQWLRVDKPPLIPSVDLSSLLSFAERIQKALPQINYKVISSIHLSTIAQPPRNSIVEFSPYTCHACGINSQYIDNEEEPSEDAKDIKLSMEYSERYHNYQRQLEQDWATVRQVTLGTIITTQVFSNLIMLEGWAQRWWEPVVWIVVACSSYWLTVRRTKQEYHE